MTATTSESRAGPSGYDLPPLVVAVSSEEPSTWVIDVRGELDLFTSSIVKQHLDLYKAKSGNDWLPRRLVFSLPELAFIDASGLRALLTAVDGHSAETITIREPSLVVRRLLELVDLGSMIERTVKL
jgi:anti-anti-sigma factor